MDVDYWAHFLTKFLTYKKIKNRHIFVDNYPGLLSIIVYYYVKTSRNKGDIDEDLPMLLKQILPTIAMLHDYSLIDRLIYRNLVNDNTLRYKEDQKIEMLTSYYRILTMLK